VGHFHRFYWATIVIHFRRFTIWLMLTFAIVGPLFALLHDDRVTTGAAVAVAFALSILAGGGYTLLAAIMSHTPESESRHN